MVQCRDDTGDCEEFVAPKSKADANCGLYFAPCLGLAVSVLIGPLCSAQVHLPGDDQGRVRRRPEFAERTYWRSI